MDSTLNWFAQKVHEKHKLKSGDDLWQDCGYWPCEPLQQAVLKGIPEKYEELDGAGSY